MARLETRSRTLVEDRNDSPLESLSRTLDSLEERLSRLPHGKGPRAPVPPMSDTWDEPARDAGVRLGTPPNRPRILAEAVSEIVMRRQALDDMSREPDAPRASPAKSAPRPQGGGFSALDASGRPLARRLENLASEAAALQKEDGGFRLMGEIAGELQRLRAEMRNDARSGFEVGFEEMREAFGELRRMIEDRESADAIGAELQTVSASLARLTEAGADRPTLNAMRSELEELRHLFMLTAREATVQAVGDRWQSFEHRYAEKAEEDIAAKAELKNELQRLRESLRSLAREDQVQAVERRWDAFEERYRDVPDQKAISQTIRDEIGGMRATLETLSDPASLQASEARWDSIEKHIETQMENSLRGLSQRMADIEAKLGELPGNVDLAALEERVRTLATGIEALARHREEADAQNFMTLEERLDEISRAIVASVPAGTTTIDMAPIERIEARIAALAARVDQVGADGNVERLAKRIVDLSARVEELAADRSGAAVAERLEALTARFETAFAEFEPTPVDTSEIEQRIAYLAERFDLAIAETEAPRVDTAAIEARLAAIAARLDETASEPRLDEGVMRSLESQIGRLSDSLGRVGSMHDDFEVDIDRRLGAIEQRLDGQRDALIEAAREVAEETARRMNAVGDKRQAEHVAMLSANLSSLEALSRSTDGRATQVFEAVHSTLLKIVDRLELIETEIAGAPASRAETPAEDFGAVFGRAEPRLEPVASPTVVPASAASPVSLVERAREAVASTRQREELAAPAMDASDAIHRSEMNRPMEPGSGMPDIGALLERVRAAQRSKMEGTGASAEDAQTRAAARMAVKAATAEVETLRDAESQAGEGGLKGMLARRRKAILTGVVAVIVALSALPIAKSFLASPTETPAVVAVPAPAAGEAPTVAETPALADPAPVQDMPAMPPVPVPDAAADLTGQSAPAQPQASAAPSTPADAMPVLADLTARLPASARSLPAVPDGIGTEALKTAAVSGDPQAAFEIGLRLMEGRTGEPRPSEALDWFAQAAAKGFAPAQYSLGTLFEKGNGVARDTLAARDWYTLAAMGGNVRAMHNLAVLYATGVDGRSQPEIASRWFLDAADHGMRDSQYNLGILYARGSGVPQDLVQSYKWFGIVAEAGDGDAAAKRDEVGKSLSPEQLKTAQDDVKAFVPAPRVDAANTVETPADWQGPKEQSTSSVDMTRAIRNIQAILVKLGYDVGVPDGKVGEKTRLAISSFQKDNGMKATGEIDGPLIRALLDKKDS